MYEVEHVLTVQSEAGESPHWNADEQALYWADIVDPHLYRYYPATGKFEVFNTSIPVTGLGIRESGGLVLASKTGLYLLDDQLKDSSYIANPEIDKPNVRFNDGLVDPQGRFWAGTLNEADFSIPDGSLYRLDPDGTLHTMDTGLKLPNGIAWSPDNSIMYLVDSFDQVIYAYDFDLPSGTISNRRILAEVPKESGMPDGITVDCEGFIWSGYWGGWRVTRFDPAGKIEREIQLPVQNVTSCIFGGADLSELYITTAWFLLNEEERSDQPAAGDLFRVRPGVNGLPDPKFAG
jgi:sugar lactone lactonase YvrE